MNKTGGNAMRLKLTNLQIALKKIADEHHRKVRIIWNQLFLEMNNIYSTNAFAFALFCANKIARLYIISTEIILKTKYFQTTQKLWV